MSPEMISRKGYHLKTDVWSMGVMFYQMLSADFATDVKGKVNEGDIKFLRTQIERAWNKDQQHDMEIISLLANVTFQMLTIDPNERPSALEVFEQL